MVSHHRLLLFLLLLYVASPSWPKEVTYQIGDHHGKHHIIFESEAPLEHIEGSASEISGFITADLDSSPPLIHGEASVQVTSMQTGIALRDQHLRSSNWLDAQKYPNIRFAVSPLIKQKILKKRENQWFSNLKGQFILKGHAQEVEIPVTIEKKEGRQSETLVISGRFVVHLEDYGIHGPAAMNIIGVKVSPDVAVNIKLIGHAMAERK